jgi:hypothetical protein
MARIERAVLLAAIRECITVVGPGEVLAVRVPGDLPDEIYGRLAEHAQAIREETGGTARIVFVAGEEFAKLRDGGDGNVQRAFGGPR